MTTHRPPDIVEFTTGEKYLGLELSDAQETLLRATYALPMSEDQLDIYRACTGRTEPPAVPVTETTIIAGARAGKDSRIAAPVAIYEALFGGHDRQLARGERGMIACVAQDQRAAGIAFGYIEAGLQASPLLDSQVEAYRTSELWLTNGIVIGVFPCTSRGLRGWSIPCGIMDELGFYRLAGMANSDEEVQTSIRRGQLGFDSPKLIKISTPYMKSGVLWEDHASYYGQDSDDVLVWQASSALMNPTLRDDRLEQVQRLDPSRFARGSLAPVPWYKSPGCTG
jgi:hypothetical protein